MKKLIILFIIIICCLQLFGQQSYYPVVTHQGNNFSSYPDYGIVSQKNSLPPGGSKEACYSGFFISGSDTLWRDISGKNRHAKINFAKYFVNSSEWLAGILPYTSEVLVTFPLSIRSFDLDSFMFDGNGIARNHPVVSFFQNIDYGDKIFCKEIQLTLNSDSTKLQYAGIKYFTIYSETQIGSNLTACKTWFVVPAKGIGKWVDKQHGSDVTGTGTFANPWKTLTKGAASVSNYDTLYVKSGIYTESALTLIRPGKLKCLGYCKLLTTSTRVITLSATNGNTIEGLILDGNNAYQTAARVYLGPSIFQRCKFQNLTTGGYKVDAATSGVECNFKYCIFIHNGGNSVANKIQTTIDQCYFNCNTTNVIYQTGGLGQRITVKYCLFYGIRTTDIVISNGYNINILGNYFYSNGGASTYVSINSSEAGTIRIRYNYLNGYTTSNSIFTQCSNFTSTDISYNVGVISSSKPSGTPVIYVVNNPNSTVNFNDILDNRLTNVSIIKFASTGTNMGNIHADNNFLKSPAVSGSKIIFGSNTTSANNNKMVPTANGNLIYSAKYYNPNLRQTINLNNDILFGFNKNCSAIKNKIIGGGQAIVMISAGDTCTSGSFSYNQLINCYTALKVSGTKRFKIYNNTIFSNTTDTVIGIYFDTNTAHSDSANVRNNIVFFKNAKGGAAFYIDNSTISRLEYNCLKTNITIVAIINNITKTYLQLIGDGYNLYGYNQDPLFRSEINFKLWSTINMRGVDLGSAYNSALDTTTIIPSSLVNKTQETIWNIGSFASKVDTTLNDVDAYLIFGDSVAAGYASYLTNIPAEYNITQNIVDFFNWVDGKSIKLIPSISTYPILSDRFGPSISFSKELNKNMVVLTRSVSGSTCNYVKSKGEDMCWQTGKTLGLYETWKPLIIEAINYYKSNHKNLKFKGIYCSIGTNDTSSVDYSTALTQIIQGFRSFLDDNTIEFHLLKPRKTSAFKVELSNAADGLSELYYYRYEPDDHITNWADGLHPDALGTIELGIMWARRLHL
jgi:hypothetical protein